jgi:hypothetical protein
VRDPNKLVTADNISDVSPGGSPSALAAIGAGIAAGMCLCVCVGGGGGQQACRLVRLRGGSAPGQSAFRGTQTCRWSHC